MIQKIITFPKKLAASDHRWQLERPPQDTLDRKETKYLALTMGGWINEVAKQLFSIENIALTGSDVQHYLSSAFMYCFDKSIEIVYNLRTGNDSEIEFSSEHMMYGMGGDRVPEYIQLKITPLIPLLLDIFSKAYAQTLTSQNQVKDEDLVKGLLHSACRLAFEVAIRIDLEDHSEMEKYLKNVY